MNIRTNDRKAKAIEPKTIQLGLMNGETIKLFIEDVECLQIFGVSENHYVTREFPFVDKYKYCSRAFIKLSKDALKKNYKRNKRKTIVDRLTELNDISDITYLDQNGRYIETILVPWQNMKEDGLENSYQFSCIDSQGNLEIVLKGN